MAVLEKKDFRVTVDIHSINRNREVKIKLIKADPLTKIKKYEDSYDKLKPGLNSSGLPDTGLTDTGWKTNKRGNQEEVEGSRQILEKELGLNPGALGPRSEFWDSFSIDIGAEDLVLNLNDPTHLLNYIVAMRQSIVAKGLKEIGQNSKAEYVLYSSEEEAATRVSARRLLKKAYMLADKLDIATKVDILNVYGIIVSASDINTIEDKIDEKIEEDPSTFLAIVDDDFLKFKALVTKCLDKGILHIENGSVYHKDMLIGFDNKAAASSIAKNNKLEAILKAKLTGDMDLITAALKDEAEKRDSKE